MYDTRLPLVVLNNTGTTSPSPAAIGALAMGDLSQLDSLSGTDGALQAQLLSCFTDLIKTVQTYGLVRGNHLRGAVDTVCKNKTIKVKVRIIPRPDPASLVTRQVIILRLLLLLLLIHVLPHLLLRLPAGGPGLQLVQTDKRALGTIASLQTTG